MRQYKVWGWGKSKKKPPRLWNPAKNTSESVSYLHLPSFIDLKIKYFFPRYTFVFLFPLPLSECYNIVFSVPSWPKAPLTLKRQRPKHFKYSPTVQFLHEFPKSCRPGGRQALLQHCPGGRQRPLRHGGRAGRAQLGHGVLQGDGTGIVISHV